MGKPKERRKRGEDGQVLPMPGTTSVRRLIEEIMTVASERTGEDLTVKELALKARRGYVMKGLSAEDIAQSWPGCAEELCQYAARVTELLVERCLPRLALIDELEPERRAEEVKSSGGFIDICDTTDEEESDEDEDVESEEERPADVTVISAAASNQASLGEKLRKCQEELVQSQKEVIGLLKRVNEMQSAELSAARGMAETVRRDLSSWSAVVTRKCQVATARRSAPPPVRKPEQKKQEEDRSRNLMVFGLPEVEGEEDPTTVLSGLMGSLNEKPTISRAARVGAPREGKARPIIATLSSREMLLTVLRKAPELKKTTDFSGVYLGPDRSWDERIERQRTLLTLGKLRAENPSRNYVMRKGMIECMQRDPAP